MAEPGTVSRLKRFYEDAITGVPDYREPLAKRRFFGYDTTTVYPNTRSMDSVGPFTVPSPGGSGVYDVQALWRQINNQEVAARKTRRNSRSLDAYQRAFFAVFPDKLPLHVEGYPIRLSFQERELWNRVKPAGRKRLIRRYKPRRYRRPTAVRFVRGGRGRAGTYRRRR